MILIKTPREIEIMKEGGKIAAGVLAEVLDSAKVGISTLELDALAEKLILSAGGKPSFKSFEGYPFATCINVNEGIVHGLPTERKLKVGDILTADLGVFYKGLHTDTARTIVVGNEQKTKNNEQFLSVGQRVLDEAIEQCRIGNHVGDISHAIQTTVEEKGYNVARELGGHGVGRKLHEPPFIPGFVETKGKVGTDSKNVVLKGGMTLAIEVIYARGSGKIEVLNDGWTAVTVDGDVAGLFEDTVAVTDSGPVVLTGV